VSVARIYYDGDCGLCHWAVKLAATHDRRRHFRFAPRNGSTQIERLGADRLADLPESMIVETADGRLLWRSSGVVYLLRRLGGGWSLLGNMLLLVPRFLRDLGYNVVVRTRHLFFARPQSSCPLLPPALRDRFDP
jgi:predicted DCC family thiol-disulfide oxidoreductase YuxK